MEVSRQLHAPAALPPGNEPWYPLDRRLGGPQSLLLPFPEFLVRVCIEICQNVFCLFLYTYSEPSFAFIISIFQFQNSEKQRKRNFDCKVLIIRGGREEEEEEKRKKKNKSFPCGLSTST
jgi:hypothetical protein